MTSHSQKILMCAPNFFGIDYVINPWMEGQLGSTDAILATKQWTHLKDILAAQTGVTLIEAQPGLPDLVFTANAGFVVGDKAIVSRFRNPERQREEPFFRDWFAANGFTVAQWPQEVFFEGAGDALIDRGEHIVWMGHGFRSDKATAPLLEKIANRRVVPLRLIDPRFYHLDTCMCPLAGGYLMYFTAAFDDEAQKSIAAIVPDNKRIVVHEEDAQLFACNSVDVNGHVIMNGASDKLQSQLKRAGFTPIISDLSQFLKSGGAAKCLTLKLVEA